MQRELRLRQLQHLVALTAPAHVAASNGVSADCNGVGAEHSSVNVFNLWFLDSGRYSMQPGIEGYDWVRPNQIAWYSDSSEVIRAANGGRVAPALAFFHIPVIEYELARERVGTTHERVYHPDINSGLYTAFVEAGDVVATFVGHDHTNDYCGKYYNLNLCCNKRHQSGLCGAQPG